MEECGWNVPGTREVCSRYPEEVQDDALQGHDHTYGSNLKLLSVASSKSIDTMMYHQMICSLMYLTDTRLDTCFAVNTLRHVHLMVEKHAGVQLIMGSSMMQIRRLTWRVMLI